MRPAEGPVSVAWASREGIEPKAAALRFAATGPGPWRGTWITDGDGVNCAGLKWLTFHIKGSPSQELSDHLMDHHKIGDDGLFDEPHFSRGVPLIAAGCLRGIQPTYRKVRVPLAKLLPKGIFFLRWHAAGIALATGKEGKAGTYYVDLIRVEP